MEHFNLEIAEVPDPRRKDGSHCVAFTLATKTRKMTVAIEPHEMDQLGVSLIAAAAVIRERVGRLLATGEDRTLFVPGH
jgi:hypothetical protein